MSRSHLILVAVAIAVGILSSTPAVQATVTTLPLPQLWQHKDTNYIPCVVPGCMGPGLHEPTCAPIPPWGHGCIHCAAYPAPAAIMMIRTYRGYHGCPESQDCLYDRNKTTDGEIPGDHIIQSHGVGLRDPELLEAFRDALRQTHIFTNDLAGDAYPPITEWVLRQLLTMGTPVLWLDRDGLPREYMNPIAYGNMIARGEGHAKVLEGYDDHGTYCEVGDDLVLVGDPWPPAGSPYPDSPYWVPVASVLRSDPNDLFAADQVGGVEVAESQSDEATAWSNGRHLVRDGSDGSYNVIFPQGGRIYFTRSREPHRPGSWSAPVPVDQMMVIHWSTEPVLAIGPSAAAISAYHAVWVQAAAPGEPGDLYTSSSADGGRTWSYPEPVHLSPFEDSRHPSADVDGLGTVIVAWDETGLEMGREIYCARRTPDAPWSVPENVSASPMLDSTFPALATSYDYSEHPAESSLAPARNVHVVWVERSILTPRSTVAYRVWDPARGWFPPPPDPPEEVTAGTGGTCPSIVAGPDRVPKVVWTTSQEPPEAMPAGPSDVLYNERTNAGWGTPILVSLPDGPVGTASLCPTIAIANGPYCLCMHVTWEEWDASAVTGDIYEAISRSPGPLWTDHTRLTYDALGVRRFPGLAYKNGTEFTKGYDLVWTDPTLHFDFMVKFLGTSVGVHGPSAVEPPAVAAPPAASATLRAWPNPFTERIELEAPAGLAGTRLSVFDVHGRRVRELANDGVSPSHWTWDGRGAGGERLPQGVYFVQAPGPAAARRVVLLR